LSYTVSKLGRFWDTV